MSSQATAANVDGKPLIKVASPQVDDADVAAVCEALRSGQLVSGPRVAEFERRFADYIGVPEAVAVNTGTAAIHAALAAADVSFGDEVIVPALTFFSTVTAVIHQGAVPVFADLSTVTFGLEPEDVERRITPRTKAILPVHYFGHAVEMDPLMAVADRHGLSVIEDCAQSHGTTYRGRRTGSIGHFGAFSLFATKHMTTGEGGIVTTHSAERADFMRKFRSHGMAGRHDHAVLGYNYRLPEMAGAMGTRQLDRLDTLNANRVRVSEALIEKIRDIPWLSVPVVPEHIGHTYFWCHVWIDEDRLGFGTEELVQRLRHEGVEVRYRYREPLYRQPVMTSNQPAILKAAGGDTLPDYAGLHLPNVERIAGRVIGLPNRPDMADWEIERVAEVLWSIGGNK